MASYKGRNVLVKVSTTGVGSTGANWVTIGYQRDGSMDYSSETADAKTKADNGAPNDVIVGFSFSVSCECTLDIGDPAYAYLQAQFALMNKVWIQVDESTIGGVKKEFQAVISKLGKKFADKDVTSVSIDLTGQGTPVTSP